MSTAFCGSKLSPSEIVTIKALTALTGGGHNLIVQFSTFNFAKVTKYIGLAQYEMAVTGQNKWSYNWGLYLFI